MLAGGRNAFRPGTPKSPSCCLQDQLCALRTMASCHSRLIGDYYVEINDGLGLQARDSGTCHVHLVLCLTQPALSRSGCGVFRSAVATVGHTRLHRLERPPGPSSAIRRADDYRLASTRREAMRVHTLNSSDCRVRNAPSPQAVCSDRRWWWERPRAAAQVEAVLGRAHAPALDLLELAEFAWHGMLRGNHPAHGSMTSSATWPR